MESTRDSLSGKTSQELSPLTGGATSGRSSKRSAKSKIPVFQYLDLTGTLGNTQDASWELATQLPGVSTTLNFGAYPSEERVSTLSQILEVNAPEKYCLSPRACRGILRRAENRGKQLPPILKEALEEVIALSMMPEETGGGLISPNLTGDHQNRVTDYTAVVVERESLERRKRTE